MAIVNDLENEIRKIRGLDGYVIVQDDGQLLLHDAVNTEELSALIEMSVFNANIIKSDMGVSLFKYFVIARKTKERLLVFPVDNFLFGLLLRPDTYAQDIINHTQSMIQNFKKNTI